jgi:hypothetical protein
MPRFTLVCFMLFALTPLTNLHRSLIYAFTFSAQGLGCLYELMSSFFLMGILYFSQDFLIYAHIFRNATRV